MRQPRRDQPLLDHGFENLKIYRPIGEVDTPLYQLPPPFIVVAPCRQTDVIERLHSAYEPTARYEN